MNMVMSWIFTGATALSCFCALLTGQGAALSASIIQGAQQGISLSIALAGSVCLWTGVGKLMGASGITKLLARCLRPLLYRVFPSAKLDPDLENHLACNICANFLGLGNAATPMGIQAILRMASRSKPGVASDEMCRLVVLNTASIQLIPANVAALRVSMGCQTPFDMLPAVWLTSLCAAFLGIAAAHRMGKLWKDG